MNVAIIGAGLIGKKRAFSLEKSDCLSMVCDIDKNAAKKLVNDFSAHYTDNLYDIINNRNIDTVIVSVINKYAKEIAVAMLESGKNVLCEKPLGCNAQESRAILLSAEKSGKLIKTGFNHRFHPAVLKTKSLLEKNEIGEIINIRAIYGHGGRPGMEKEWRCSKDLAGGGELLDQGVHIIDLCRWFTSMDVATVYGKTYTSFWQTNVEDNVFFNLEFNNNILAQCHVSWTNWKNIFSFEIFGNNGYIKIAGLGGNYGIETLEVGYRKSGGGAPTIERFEFPQNDSSWSLEWHDFKDAIIENREPNGSGKDGLSANKVVDAIYKANELNKHIFIN